MGGPGAASGCGASGAAGPVVQPSLGGSLAAFGARGFPQARAAGWGPRTLTAKARPFPGAGEADAVNAGSLCADRWAGVCVSLQNFLSSVN